MTRPAPTALDYALGAAATARLARLATMDTIFTGPRLAFVRKMDSTDHPRLAELAVCPWCISVWIGVVVSIGLHRGWPGFRWMSGALAFSLAAGLANELGRERDD
ncbi:MAG TPA: hypothetical protein VGM93_14520 [Acidimicrobiales bacterium]